MSQEKPPEGLLFTHLYRERGKATEDSVRMRRRLGALFYEHANTKAAAAVERQLGIRPKWQVADKADWRTYFAEVSLDDLLDTITTVVKHLSITDGNERNKLHLGPLVRHFVSRIFAEENVSYILDDRGGVHPRVDTAFERETVATIASLQDRRYRATLESFESGLKAMGERPPNGKSSIRGVFGAAEILFRLMATNAPRLGAKEATEHLKPLLDTIYRDDVVALRASQKSLNSFCSWVDAAHFYRHEQGKEDPSQPPHEVAVLLLSQGTAFVRWLANLDGQNA